MIRGTLCAVLVILSLLTAVPVDSRINHFPIGHQTRSLPTVPGHDPNGTLVAFNATRAQFDLYTKQNATWVGGATPIWVGNTFNDSRTGLPVPNTSFNVTISASTQATENVTFANMPVPKGNVSSTTYLRFDWRGSQSNQTRASYYVYNETRQIFSFSTKGNITGGRPNISAGSPPVGCDATDNCFDVTPYVGFNLTLVFKFDSNSTGRGLNIKVYTVAIASADAIAISSSSHSMRLDQAIPTQVDHNAVISSFGYFANVTYHKPGTTNINMNHNWTQMIVTYYYPNSYSQVTIAQNGTSIFGLSPPPPYPVAQGNCPSFFPCTQSHFVSLNMTGGIKHALIALTAHTLNLGASVVTTLGGVPTTSWGPGDLLQVKVDLLRGVNATGIDTVSANKTGIVRVSQSFPNTREGISLLNFTTPIPQDVSLLGQWAVNNTFTNGYDLGFSQTTFNLQQLSVSGFSYSGDNQRLTAQGNLAYNPSNPTIGVNGFVFAIDNGTGAAPISTPTITSGTGVYISNISLVNGVFTTGQQLVILFTLVNPSTGTMINRNANLTIDHEYTSGTTHQSNVTISLPQGYDTFTLNSKYVYELDATFTPAGIQIVVKGVNVGGSSISALLPPGNPPVTSLRQHAGLFKMTIGTEPLSGTGSCVPSCKNSLESPAYAYVLVNPPVPGRLLASGSFTSSSTGAFSTVLSSDRILGATNLAFLTLGIDSSGFSITIQGQSSQESTLIQSTLDSIASVTQNQLTTLTLHLRSNSNKVNMNISITLNIQDATGKTQVTQTLPGIYLTPGQTKDVPFSFNAPASVGAYTVTFLSPDYGAPLITGTLQVAVLQSNLQVLIPAIIGVVAAIVILLFFMMRKSPASTTQTTAKSKPAGGKQKPNPAASTSKSLT